MSIAKLNEEATRPGRKIFTVELEFSYKKPSVKNISINKNGLNLSRKQICFCLNDWPLKIGLRTHFFKYNHHYKNHLLP